MTTPSVSILIPVYNGAMTVGRCLDSALSQDYSDLEVVVVDDHSTDDTAGVLAGYRDRARVLRNERNSGIARTYNRAIRESRGEIVVMLASDCALVGRDYVTRLVRHFEDPTVGAVAGKAVIPDFDSARSIERIFARLNILDINDPDTGVRQVNFVEVRCDGFRRSVLEAVEGLNEDLFRSNEDQDLSIRIARRNYRLLQDNSLQFRLGFGGTEDTLGKLLSKQAQYARGQAYIAVRYGVGSREGLWDNANRKRRALHRMTQVASIPVASTLAVAASVWSPAWLVLAALATGRIAQIAGLPHDLRPTERLAALPLGLCCDLIYSASFLTNVIAWIAQGKSRLTDRAAGNPRILRERR
jgi:glycosyltransferase involved in cell wall biosynthesis